MLGRLLQRRGETQTEQRWSLSDVAEWFAYNGHQYPLGQLTQTLGQTGETIPNNFEPIVSRAYYGNGIVFACQVARMLVFSQARFQYQQLRGGRPGDLFGLPELEVLNGTDWLLSRMEQDASLSGNAYIRRTKSGLTHMRPDWTTILLAERPEAATSRDVRGYLYWPEGPGGAADPVTYLAEEVAHYAPIPDPLALYRGMSWLTPVLREIEADTDATKFKSSYWVNGATPNMVVSFDAERTLEQVREFRDLWNETHQGADNAFKTAFLGGGADVKPVGSSLEQADVKNVQGAGETRIAAAAGVPPVVVGLSESMQGSSLNAGNYGMARRRFADGTLRPLWAKAAGALANIVSVPGDARLWYDDRHIDFLQEDRRDDAEILATQAQAIRALSDSGAEWDAVVDAVVSGDLARLKGNHSGLFSVQLQPPGFEEPDRANPLVDALARWADARARPALPAPRGLRVIRGDDGEIEEIRDAAG